MIGMLRDALTIAGKDLRNELRSKQTIGMMLVFSALVILIFSFAFDLTNQMVKAVIPGLIWVVTIFAGIFGLNKSFVSERENESIAGLRIAPIDLLSIYIGKVMTNFVLVGIVQVVTIPLLFLFLDYRFNASYFWFIFVLFCGTFGFVMIGTFLAALAANGKNSEMLLPVLLLPLITPLMIGAVQATTVIVNNEELNNLFSWLKFMAAYDLLFAAACFLLFDYILED